MTDIPPAPPPHNASWWSTQNTLVAALLLVSAWSLGAVITSSSSNSSLSKQVSTLQDSVRQHEAWIVEVQKDQKKAAELTSEALAKISTSVAELKGAATVRTR